jgi:hypothetical protein
MAKQNQGMPAIVFERVAHLKMKIEEFKAKREIYGNGFFEDSIPNMSALFGL